MSLIQIRDFHKNNDLKRRKRRERVKEFIFRIFASVSIKKVIA
jgi:hypothetical protein